MTMSLPPSSILTVHAVSAHGLSAKRSQDLNKLADPYLTLTVGGVKMTSKVVKNTLAPRFEQSFEFYPEDCREEASDALRDLRVRVLDKDRATADDLLGECTISLKEALDRGEWEEPLHPQGGFVVRLARLHVPPHTLARGRLAVTLIDADGLTPADAFSRSADPYVKLSCGGNQHRSRVVAHSLQPRG